MTAQKIGFPKESDPPDNEECRGEKGGRAGKAGKNTSGETITALVEERAANRDSTQPREGRFPHTKRLSPFPMTTKAGGKSKGGEPQAGDRGKRNPGPALKRKRTTPVKGRQFRGKECVPKARGKGKKKKRGDIEEKGVRRRKQKAPTKKTTVCTLAR